LQVLAVRAPRDLYTLAISQEFYKERKTLLWLLKTGLKLDSQDFKQCTWSFSAHKQRDFTGKKVSTLKKKLHVTILSKVNYSIHFFKNHSSALINELYFYLHVQIMRVKINLYLYKMMANHLISGPVIKVYRAIRTNFWANHMGAAFWFLDTIFPGNQIFECPVFGWSLFCFCNI
jgi:hypothetical protein